MHLSSGTEVTGAAHTGPSEGERNVCLCMGVLRSPLRPHLIAQTAFQAFPNQESQEGRKLTANARMMGGSGREGKGKA